MRALATSAALLAGCTFGTTVNQTGEMPGEAGVPLTDGKSIDAQPLDGCTTFSTALDTCAIGTYGAGISISGNRRYDTVLHILSDDNGGNPSTPNFREVTVDGNPITLLVVENLTIQAGARLRVTGARAFGVVATGTISIVGTLDATNGGAGARSLAACDLINSNGEGGRNNNSGSGGASGGGGGGFRGMGGKGAVGDSGEDNLQGGNGGATLALATTFIGGCPGGKGGDQQNSGDGGAGGLGGGSVLLVSAMTLSIPGIVNTGGGGGKRGTQVDGGGGGGGSGGLIALEAAAIQISGFAVANGGGGGGGAGNNAGQDGFDGQQSATNAPGGGATGGGSTGGTGGALTQNAGQQPANAAGGGGGGGGGVGYVTIKSGAAPTITGIVSPEASPWPFP